MHWNVWKISDLILGLNCCAVAIKYIPYLTFNSYNGNDIVIFFIIGSKQSLEFPPKTDSFLAVEYLVLYIIND